ncbi:glutaminyl-tRNA synthetase [Salinisphaera orenii MK-B5]|uniref:Glutamine--tRNA ligase n=2 Tax=Salinisphaera orenii TaxID=856731 RepID=A0A423PMV7_9GAMM|nr:MULTISPECIES: glutamine--tRNA ligase/YqeY domain fusion protein [Salinisphaera]ROO26930.1 glutaminyl-tRNA synthetase [Salinisphaera orenii MK-B5]ROO32970.1 glutaminyl-tRNA synthetase [Salinisphaera halophila YIM 95161]
MTDNASDASRAEPRGGHNFLRQLIADQIARGEHHGEVVTRFPPEPNGYLHIGHAKSICLNFGLAEHFGGKCRLRFDDTNPEKEEQEYIDSIQADVHWLGFDWEGAVRFTSDYFDTLYDYALHLIEQGHAYVDELSSEQAREYRGDWNTPGTDSPYRERSVEDNLAAFEKMRAGGFAEGEAALRAKIDMAAGNMNLRDPIIYRVRHAAHHQTGDAWCIYPSYDFAHGQSDAIEGVTHSICTLEFEDHRPLYNWFIEHLPVPARPVQYEFGRLHLNYTITSKRRLRRLIDAGIVDGWDDPRMPTLSGIRRRGYTPASIRAFCETVGVSRSDGVVDTAVLENAVRDDLNHNAPRAMCVMDPLKLVITNLPEEAVEMLAAPGHPNRDDLPARTLPFTREVFIEKADFRESANKKYKRLVLGKRVRLRNAYVVEATDVVRDDAGEVIEVHCRYDPDTLGDNPADGVKPRGVIHWVSASHGRRALVRAYDRLFATPNPGRETGDFLDDLNPASLEVHAGCWIEPGLAEVEAEQRVQFERIGYFVADRFDHLPGAPVFNRVVPLRDSWSKIDDGR